MFNVYIEREIFEDICLYDDYPNWKKIFSEETQVLLNMSDKELDGELLDDESPIFLFQDMNAAAVIPIALDDQFDALKKDISNVINHPRDAFIFDIEPEEAQTISTDLGVAVFSSKDLSDSYFTGGLFKELEFNQTVKGGWQSLVSMELPVSNSLVMSDAYFFENEEDRMNCGIGNLPNLLDAFLPESLQTDYHITILAQNGKKGRSWWIKEFAALKDRVSNLRDYEIKLEIVFTRTSHKRRIISNYMNGWTDKGFTIFRNSNPNKVRDDNDIHLYRIFDNINNVGDTHYLSASKGLEQLRDQCDQVVAYIKKQGDNDHVMIFGDTDKETTIKNRLLS